MDNKQTFITAIQTNEALLYKLAGMYTNTPEDRHDLVQEIIYNLWKSFHLFDNRSALTTWMYRVGLNVAIHQNKKSKRSVPMLPLHDGMLALSAGPPNDVEEKIALLREQLNTLNELDKAIVLLYLDDKSYDEIAHIVGITATNVGTKLARIKEKLKKQITKKI